MIVAARTPRMITTTMISIRVNPPDLLGPRTVPVRSGFSGAHSADFSKPLLSSHELRTGTVRAPRCRVPISLNTYSDGRRQERSRRLGSPSATASFRLRRDFVFMAMSLRRFIDLPSVDGAAHTENRQQYGDDHESHQR